MQQTRFGFGFSSSILTKEEFKNIRHLTKETETRRVQFRFLSFSDVMCGKEFGTILLLDLGIVPEAQDTHLSSIPMSRLTAQYENIFKEKQEEIHKELKSVGLEHYIKHVELLRVLEDQMF